MAAAFDPGAFPVLVALGNSLREMAGESMYAAGRELVRSGAVREATIAGTLAQAVVQGSTDYRVSLSFSRRANSVKAGCTCPAQRRRRMCKHVVAVCLLLLERPSAFTVLEPADIPKPAKTRRPRKSATKTDPETTRAKQRADGLAVVDRLLEELAASGAAGLGPEGLELVRSAAETVRVLKLRRLGNALLTLVHIVESGRAAEEPGEFADALRDVWMMRQMVGAHLEGRISLDAGTAASLIGKTWRASELERIGPLELVPVAEDHESDGEFRIQSVYHVDLLSGSLYVERLITPRGIRAKRLPSRRMRLHVPEAAIYPGLPPHRIQILREERAPLRRCDVGQVVALAGTSVASLHQELRERMTLPFASPELPVLFRPSALLVEPSRVIARDDAGQAVDILWPTTWSRQLPAILPEAPSQVALVGLAGLSDRGPVIQCLSLVGSLRWGNGPSYPEMS